MTPDHFDRPIGDPRPKPLPEGPKHCRGCGEELEPLRRYAGLCKSCIRRKARPALSPTARVKSQYRVVRRFVRERADGRKEGYVVVRCERADGKCGTQRTMKASNWRHHRPVCCNACRLRDVDANGFEAEHGR